MEYDVVTQRHLAAADRLLNYEVNNQKLLKMHKSTAKTRLILGGKRSGKTTWGVVECCWAALGIHPYLDYPDPPLKIRVCGVSNEGVRAILLPMFLEWLPRHAIKKLPTKDDMTMVLQNGTFIEFKSYEQDVEKYEGTERHICFDLETEILSRKGWVGSQDLKVGDEILTFNKQTEQLEWKPLRMVFVKDNDSALVWLHNSQFDAMVTEEHRWVVYPKKKGKLWTNKLVTTSELSKNHKIPLLAAYNCPIEKIYSDELVTLIGWIIGDGNYPKNHQNSIRVHQSLTRYPEKCEIIRNLMKKIFNNKNTYEYITPYNKEPLDGKMLNFVGKGDIARLIRAVLPEKKLTPDFLYQLTKEQLILLYEALINSDGSRSGNDDYFSQKNSKGLPEFQILCLLLGFKSRQIQYEDGYGRVHISRSTRYGPFVNVGSLKKDYVMRDQVWCVNTENDTVIAKRNGTVYITANCWMDEEPPRVLYESNFMRTISSGINGRLIITCTPLHGMNWIYDELYDNPMAVPPAVEHIHVAIFDNPHLGAEALDTIKKDPAMQDSLEAVLYGQFVPKSGLVYKDFGDQHILPPVDKPNKDWMIVLGLDLHNRNPHGIVFMGLDKDQVWTVYDEIYEHLTIDDLAAKIKKKVGDRWPPVGSVIDTSSNIEQSTSGMTEAQMLTRKYGFYIIDAHKDVEAGLGKLTKLLAGSKPGLKVTENCRNVIREFRHYVWDDWARAKDKYNPKEAPKKKDDHLLDAIRYVCMTDLTYRPPGWKYERKTTEASKTTGYYLGKKKTVK